ncbi:MAG: hypothetical protein R3C14_20425 [Caldilineaceae bacterium]
MSKQAPLIEWYVAEDDREWERLCRPSLPNSPTSTTPKYLLWHVTGVLLCCLCVVGWWMYRAPLDHATITAELHTIEEINVRICADGNEGVASNRTGCVLELAPDNSESVPKHNDTPIPKQLTDRQALAEYQATLGE